MPQVKAKFLDSTVREEFGELVEGFKSFVVVLDSAVGSDSQAHDEALKADGLPDVTDRFGDQARFNELRLEDRSTLNGSRLGRRRLHAGQQLAPSGCYLQIGKTSLRISDSSSSVAPARELTAVDGFYEWASSSLVCVAVLAAVLLYAAFNVHLSSNAAIQTTHYFEKLAKPLGTMMLVAMFWAFVGRIVERRTNFVAHLTIAALTQFIMITWATLVSILTLNLDLVALLPVSGFLGRGVIFIASIELHLRLATDVTARRRWMFELLVLVIMFVYPLYKQINRASQFQPIARYNSSLLPPSLQFYSTTPSDEFLREAADVFTDAERVAMEKRAEAESEED